MKSVPKTHPETLNIMNFFSEIYKDFHVIFIMLELKKFIMFCVSRPKKFIMFEPFFIMFVAFGFIM
jgi:hypothetical protein